MLYIVQQTSISADSFGEIEWHLEKDSYRNIAHGLNYLF